MFSLKDESPVRPGSTSTDSIRPGAYKPKKRYDPGDISDWTPGPAYVSENDPVPRKSFEEQTESETLRERRTVSFEIWFGIFEHFMSFLSPDQG